MKSTTVTVDHVHAADRFAYWREEWCNSAGVTGELAPADRDRFYACATAWTAPCVIRLRLQTASFRVSRGVSDISRHRLDDWICLYEEMGDGAIFQYAGKDIRLRSGDLLLTDPTIPFSSQPCGAHDYRRWLLPRAWLEPHLPAGCAPLSAPLTGSHGINGLVRAYLHALDDAVEQCEGSELSAVIDNFCRLLASACGGSLPDQRVAARAARLRQVQDHIALHLSEPDLSPTKVAAAMKISVRQLHLLFEPTGTSFAEHVLRRRLHECRVILERSSSRTRSVTDIAYAWGFNSLSSFYRAFHREFGVTPGHLRRR
jgi:AraC-like DNA-binding protein